VFLVWSPTKYSKLLGQYLDKHPARVWLINTGWTGGAYGVGKRISLGHTRAIVRAVLSGSLDNAPVATDPVFGLAVPTNVTGVPDSVLRPRDAWADRAAYDAAAAKLAGMFRSNFETVGADAYPEVRAAGPRG
jgi:phosphoenolpyruvate carboxykinase (ATP)